MSEIIKKLVDNLKWRLTPAGKKFRPKRAEIESWGTRRIPPSVPFLVWVAFIMVCLFGSFETAGLSMFEPATFFVLGPGGWVISGLVLRQINRAINRNAIFRAYRKLLKSNERFSLVEYTRYLERQIIRAKADPSLGGVAEVTRLLGVYGEMAKLLREGAGEKGRGAIDSALAEDADIGEALVQSLEELKSDPLLELDSRLPPELLNRVMDLERSDNDKQRQPSIDQH